MRLIFCFLLTGVLVTTSRAYVVYTDSSGIYVETWNPGTIPMQIKLPTSPALIDGNSYASSVQAAMSAWNTKLGTVQFAPTTINTASPAPSGSYSNGNGINEIVMDTTYGGKAFGTGVLAITLSYTSGDTHVESDIVFNVDPVAISSVGGWDSFRGGRSSNIQDIQRVAIHELGHVLGLNHPDQATPPQSVTAIMNSHVSYSPAIDTMQPDDIAGAQLLYGAPGFVPANNDFANATVINLGSGSIQLTGTNVAATRQSGEPNHAGANAPNGHSVWWKWTAPSSGSTTIDTLGSNFDTALAVYTGSAVTALTLVASNDDVQNGVIRTSTVTFNAVGGTTYAIAVDGWGSVATGDQFTATGAITLNFSTAGALTAPAFTTQPVGQTVNAGQTVTFSAAASGNPTPTYQWQKAGVNIAGATNNTFSITSAIVTDAGSYSVVATNSVSSVSSATAQLSVDIAPANAVITITVQ